jgi:superfamily I DNA/RNA helicase
MSEATHQVYEREPGQDDGEEDFPSDTSEYAAAALYDPWRPMAVEPVVDSTTAGSTGTEDLDEAQAAAVDHWTGPALVTAGPGSGKTRVLTSRVMRLVDRGASPEEILAITFTRKAATEMKDRLLKHSERFDRSTISTYHSLALSLLREWPLLVERRGRFSVWDDAMSKSEMNKCLKTIWGKRMELKENTPRSKVIHKFLGLWKRLDRPLHGPDFLAACTRVHPVCAAIIREYEIDKKNANALDFDDLLWRAVYLLERHPDVRKQVRTRWRFVLVDEYQDTNPLQERFIRLVTNEDDNIFVVGDVDQCIPEGQPVLTPSGPRSIEQIREGDEVMSSVGGKMEPRRVTKVSRTMKDSAWEFETETGNRFQATDEHILFTSIGEPAGYYVYMMYRDGYGFRVGSTQSSGSSGLISVNMRTRQENADRMWIVGIAASAAQAHLLEHTLAYRYQVPMAPFIPREGTMFKDAEEARLFFQEFSQNGKRLLDAFKLDFDRPTYLPKASNSGRIAVNVNLAIRRGNSKVEVESNSIPPDTAAACGFTASKKGCVRFRHEYTSAERAMQEARRIALLCSGYIVCSLSCSSRMKMLETPASGVFPGMKIPEVDKNGTVRCVAVVRRTRVPTGWCRDLQVDQTANFVVGRTVVHNSIFGFQGAQIDHILTFQERWTGTKTYHLGENYRSTRNIVEAATRAIANNRERIDKHLFTRNDQGWAIETRLCRDAWDEAELAASLVAGSLDAGYTPKEHAILVRLRRQIPSIQTALAKWNIVFQTVGYIELHQRADVKRILAWFQVLMNLSDTAAASMCLSHWPGLGAATVNAWAEHSTQSARPMFDLFDFMKGQKGFGGKRGEHVLAFAETWKEFRALTFGRTSIRRLVAWLFEHTGMNAEMETKFNDPDAAEAAEARKSFRDQFVEMCPDTVVDRVDIEITSFLDALLLNAKKPDQQETVTISTIHSAKGREWDHVWILGVNESVLPHMRQGRTNIEEERRLFYVAMTRARTRLVLMHSRYIITYGKEQSPATPSRFLAEIGEAERLDDFWSVDTPELEDEDEVPDFFDFVETPLPESDTPDDRPPWVLDEHQ